MWLIPEIQSDSGEGPSKLLLWRIVITGAILAGFFIYALIEVNTMKGALYRRDLNIALTVFLAIDVWAVWNCAKLLRSFRKPRS